MTSQTEKFPYTRTALLSTGTFASNIAWSVFVIYVPLFIRRNFLAAFPDSPLVNFVVGAVMVLDNVAALIIQPYVGALSDRIWVKKIGRRMPFILIGIPLAAVFLGFIGTFETQFLWLLISICVYNISMAIFKTPVLSLIPDSLPESFRSEGSGMTSIIGGIGSITGLLLSAALYPIKSGLAFWSISVLMITCLVILIFSVREKKDQVVITEKQKPQENVFQYLRKRKNRPLLFALIAAFCCNSGYQVAETFMSSYTVTVLEFSENQANYVLATLGIMGIIVAFPAALVGKARGPRDACIIGAVIFSILSVPLAYFSLFDTGIIYKVFTLNSFEITYQFFIILFMVLLFGFSATIININLLVVIWDMASKSKIATYTGFYYLFVSTAAIISPLIAGIFFDLIELFFPVNGLQGIFLFVVIAYAIGAFSLFRVRSIQKSEFKSLSEDERSRIENKAKIRETLLLPLILFGFGARERPVKKLKKKLKDDRKLFARNFKEFVRDGDLEPGVFRDAMKELKSEQMEEIKELKKEIKEYKKDLRDLIDD